MRAGADRPGAKGRKPLFRLQDLGKTYDMGDVKVRRWRGSTLTCSRASSSFCWVRPEAASPRC